MFITSWRNTFGIIHMISGFQQEEDIEKQRRFGCEKHSDYKDLPD